MKVLFAVDGSNGSFEALEQVAPLLHSGEDQAVLYCSLPQLRVDSGHLPANLVAEARSTLGQSIMAEAAKRCPTSLTETMQRIEGTHDPRQGILAAAEQAQVDLIVVGARGLNRFERMLLGSVSRAVVHGSRVPVWVARPRPSGRPDGYRVVLACERPATAARPIELLSHLQWPEGTTCSALTVVSSLFAGSVPQWLVDQARSTEVETMARQWAREHDSEVKNNLEELEQLVARHPKVFGKGVPIVAEGEPAEQILATAARQHADLLVIGARHPHHTLAAMFGSTCEAVLNHAECSVLVVPHADAP